MIQQINLSNIYRNKQGCLV